MSSAESTTTFLERTSTKRKVQQIVWEAELVLRKRLMKEFALWIAIRILKKEEGIGRSAAK
jgi:hypothetical protein